MLDTGRLTTRGLCRQGSFCLAGPSRLSSHPNARNRRMKA
jgi:hypothetical protein